MSVAADGAGTARVIATFGRQSFVKTADGSSLVAVSRGRHADVSVGDVVDLTPLGSGQAVIEKVHPRRNELTRSDNWRTKRLAANIDQVAIVVSGSPPFSDELLDRVLASAQDQQIDAAVIANKVDLREAREVTEKRLPVYEALGYRVFRIAAKQEPQQSRATLAPWLCGRTTLLVGQSGMGKSTLINTLVPDALLATQIISQALSSGKHTTTFTRLFELPAGMFAPVQATAAEYETGADRATAADRACEVDRPSGAGHPYGAAASIIDSPGFQTFGLAHLSDSQRMHSMREFVPLLGHCRFNNCLHCDEPGCAITAAVKSGAIDRRRYESYRRITAESARG